MLDLGIQAVWPEMWLKWPLWGLFCLVGCGLLSSGIWLCTEGQFLKGVVLMIPGAVCAVVGTVILCVYF